MINLIPKPRADDDRSRGILFPDDGERLVEVVIPERGRELAVWFIEHFKKNVVRDVLITRGNLPPEREESLLVPFGIIGERGEFVQVENDCQSLLPRALYRPVEHF